MLEKIKINFSKIVLVLSCAAVFFNLPSLFSLLKSSISDATVVSFVTSMLLIASGVVFAVAALKNILNNKVILCVGLVLLVSSNLFECIYSIIDNNSFYYIPYLALYVATLVLYFVQETYAMAKNLFKVALSILVLLFTVITLNGALVPASCLLLYSIFTLNYYLNEGGKENEGI